MLPFTHRRRLGVRVPEAFSSGSAENADVQTGIAKVGQSVVDYLRQVADETERSIPLLEEQIEHLKDSLEAKRAQVEKLWAEATAAEKNSEE